MVFIHELERDRKQDEVSFEMASLFSHSYWQSILIMPDAFVFIIWAPQLQYQEACIYIISMIYRIVQEEHNDKA